MQLGTNGAEKKDLASESRNGEKLYLERVSTDDGHLSHERMSSGSHLHASKPTFSVDVLHV